MNVILYCPDGHPAVPALSCQRPLVLTPFLGQTVLEHAIAGLAAKGVKRVRIVAVDRVEEIRNVVGRGEAWGVEIEFSQETDANSAWPDARTLVLDALPQLPQQPLWRSYRDWYAAQQALLPLMGRQRVGMREVAPDVFVSLRSQVADDARLLGPCWVGANVFVGQRATIGPGSIIEDRSYIDGGAEIAGSVVGPKTYVGAFTELSDSFAWGNELLHLDTGSLTEVTDRFLLGELRGQSGLADGLLDAVRFLRHGSPKANSRQMAAPRTRLEPLLGN